MKSGSLKLLEPAGPVQGLITLLVNCIQVTSRTFISVPTKRIQEHYSNCDSQNRANEYELHCEPTLFRIRNASLCSITRTFLWSCTNTDSSTILHIPHMHFNVLKYRGQLQLTVQAWAGPEGSKCLGSQISRQSVHEGGKVVSPTHRPPLPPSKYSWCLFLLESESTPGP
jgi:hypothetical protein